MRGREKGERKMEGKEGEKGRGGKRNDEENSG